MSDEHRRHVIYFNVLQGNSSLISLAEDQNILVDLHQTDDGVDVLDYLKSVLPENNSKPYLSVFCVTHAHDDHILGCKQLLKDFLVGEIWYPNYDRFQMEEGKQSKDYKALHKEIDRRRKANSDDIGDITKDLTAMMEFGDFCGEEPEAFWVRVLSPYKKDEEDPDKDINDMSIVMNVTVSDYRFLYPGDSSDDTWCARIIPYMLKKDEYKDWAFAEVLLASHHGSHSFFDKDREQCLKKPNNSDAMSYIQHDYLVVSSQEKLPLSKDGSGEDPPHYAAYKWYKKDMVDRKLANDSDKHPKRFLYTCDGNILFELGDGGWTLDEDWNPDDGDEKGKGYGSYTERKFPSSPAPRKYG